ncbi:YraN family protein [Flammeovirga yaeyamensis]|uniref:UPF0102 protein KMW28_08970 n=1 Tax=Flammeovirga yaeyamensis TaxID=367791 RepID=A0AAX1N894_9BACT|nr:YraN family protein [Flammeovirga yaeyamensis]MBB3698904.1 putative endonuclease [Flammeovirga yaeyamensis]NMF36339.1 YraN family protein [Flammeovirga yaeyamensis]QWG03700.1 YraN family protein [Flammeovirga yaeyamensis]
MTSNKTQKQELGTKGEDIAYDYLKNKGYTILRKNFRSGRNEIDIICKKNRFLVFVEVKTRTNLSFGMPEQHLSKQQERNIINAAVNYMEFNKLDFLPLVRYDVISVILNNGEYSVRHFTDAFY